MRRLIKKLNPKEYATMYCHMQADNITDNLNFKVYFTLPKLRAKTIVAWGFHVNDSAKGRYDMILGREILTAL